MGEITWLQDSKSRQTFLVPQNHLTGGFVVSGLSYNLYFCYVNTSSKNLIAQKSKFSLNETRCVIFNSKNDTSNVNDWQLIAQKTTNEKLPGSRSGHCARVPPANTYID